MKKITNLFMLIMFSSMVVFAQTGTEGKVSDKELKQFTSALQQVQIIDQQAQQDMVKAVEEEGLKVERFNEIYQAQQDPNQEADATDEEIEKYISTSGELEKIQGQAQNKIQKKIVKEGLTISRYQEIAQVIQSSPELQQKLQQNMQK